MLKTLDNKVHKAVSLEPEQSGAAAGDNDAAKLEALHKLTLRFRVVGLVRFGEATCRATTHV